VPTLVKEDVPVHLVKCDVEQMSTRLATALMFVAIGNQRKRATIHEREEVNALVSTKEDVPHKVLILLRAILTLRRHVMTMNQILFRVHRLELVGTFAVHRFIRTQVISLSHQHSSPCPNGQTRCGAFEGFPGVCTSLCCEETEETCYDAEWEPLYCAAISGGGCPCLNNQVKCGATKFYSGYCSDICCDLTTEGEISCVINELSSNAEVCTNASSCHCL
jgi:hypothetical protein